MLSVLLAAIFAQSINDDVIVPTPEPITPSPFVEPVDPPGPIVNIDIAAAEAAMLASVAEQDSLPVMYSPPWCGSCESWERFLDGMIDIRVVDTLPAGQPLAPAIQRADGAWWDWSQGIPQSRDAFAEWASEGQSSAVAAPQPVGSVDLGGILAYLDLIEGGELSGRLPADPIKLNDSLTLTTNAATWRLLVEPQSKSVKFQPPLPSIRWAAFRVDIEGVKLAGSKLTVELRRLPDWTLEVN